jgi:hypothetical protein
MRLRTFPMALASVVLLAAACGDDDSKSNAQSSDGGPDSSAPSTSTKAGAGGAGRASAGRGGAGASGSRGGAGQGGDEAPSGGKAGEGAGSAGKPAAGSPATAGRSGGAGRGGPSAGAGGRGGPTAGAGGTTPVDAGVGVGEDDAGTIPVGGPYFTSAGLQGYVWLAPTGAGTTLRVTGYATTDFTPPVCIRGSVAATPDSSGNAMLGVNLNQPLDGELGTLRPTSAGLQINVTNLGASPLRIQIQTPDGATNDQGRWCAIVNGSGGFIPWSDFNTACWDGSGAAYARQPIVSAILLVPGTTGAAIPYDVCLNGLAQGAGDDADAGE